MDMFSGGKFLQAAANRSDPSHLYTHTHKAAGLTHLLQRCCVPCKLQTHTQSCSVIAHQRYVNTARGSSVSVISHRLSAGWTPSSARRFVSRFSLPCHSRRLTAPSCRRVCASVYLSVGAGFVGALYGCQSRAEEATFSSFSCDLLALCNRSELLLLPPPDSRPSILTENTRRQLVNEDSSAQKKQRPKMTPTKTESLMF